MYYLYSINAVFLYIPYPAYHAPTISKENHLNDSLDTRPRNGQDTTFVSNQDTWDHL
ncbi:hypothetical protein RSC2_03521 [Bacillus paralicheniformis]|nr:hypothetical protein RSC1_01667 [Bacillus paralicheniformis]BCE11725.1 hypothetical protein RSC2_03521 [Bacillus paralicheniformis]